MPQIIEVPGMGEVEFPDGMSDADISAAIQKSMPQTSEAPKRNVSPRVKSGADAAILGALDTATFGFLDEAGAGIDRGIDYITGREGKTYDEYLAGNREEAQGAQDEYGGSYLAGQIGGALIPGMGAAKAGLSLGANAVKAGSGLGRTAMMSAADGVIAGSLQGAGSGQGVEGRVQGAIAGGALGGAGGAVAPYAVAGVSAVAKPFLAPILARLHPDDYANRALAEGLARSGATPDEIVQRLQQATDDGQGMFNVADAMGNAGQRLLAVGSRTPNVARQGVVEGLQARQMGQGERLSNFLAEGFDAPDTAAQRTARLTAERSSAADTNYGAARAGSRPVDASKAVQTADLFIRPGSTGVLRPETNIADDSVEAAVRKARGYLTDGKSMVTDFDAAFRAKLELDNMIDGAKPLVAKHLRPIRQALDDALAKSSPDYAGARDAFRRQSQTIDAVEAGTGAASGRTRATDNLQQFGALRPDEQQAFRAGYVDPIIAGVERASSSPTTNKARQLLTEKTRQEFPAFAAPGRGDQLGRRIDREQRMFETANAALGGSKTADNLADIAEAGEFDPNILLRVWKGSIMETVISSAAKMLDARKGLSPSVVARISRTLMETRPDAVRKILADAMQTKSGDKANRALANTILTNLGSSGSGRLQGGGALEGGNVAMMPGATPPRRQPLEITVGRSAAP